MNEDESMGHDVDGHVSPDIYHVNGLQGKCLGADDRLHRGPSDVFVSSVSKGATTKSSTKFANLSDSSSEEMKQKEITSTILFPLLHYKSQMLINA